MKYIQTFKVKGNGMFPFDMLRYDRCWPKNESEMADLTISHSDSNYRDIRTIELSRYVRTQAELPTLGRWASFGWVVLQGSIKNLKLS